MFCPQTQVSSSGKEHVLRMEKNGDGHPYGGHFGKKKALSPRYFLNYVRKKLLGEEGL